MPAPFPEINQLIVQIASGLACNAWVIAIIGCPAFLAMACSAGGCALRNRIRNVALRISCTCTEGDGGGYKPPIHHSKHENIRDSTSLPASWLMLIDGLVHRILAKRLTKCGPLFILPLPGPVYLRIPKRRATMHTFDGITRTDCATSMQSFREPACVA